MNKLKAINKFYLDNVMTITVLISRILLEPSIYPAP